MSQNNNQKATSNWIKKHYPILFVLCSVVIGIIVVFYLVTFVLSLFSTPLPTYHFIHEVNVTNSTNNTMKLTKNTLIIINGSNIKDSIYVYGNATAYVNMTGDYNIIKIYGINNSNFVLNLNGNNNNIYSFNISNIGFVILGSGNTYYKNNEGSCTQYFYQYSFDFQKKVIFNPC